MNKFGLALVLLALFAAPYSYAMELFSMDCNGGVRFLPSYPIGGKFDFSDFLGVADTFLALYKTRLQCACPGLTENEFNKLLHPFFGADMAFNIMQGPDADLNLVSCPWSNLDGVWMRADKFASTKVDLTDTCNYNTWKTNGKCLLQSQTFSDWDVTVKAGIFKCANAPWRPAFSVICEGAGCQQAFIPCMSDSDCAGDMRCKQFTFDQLARPTTEDILSALKSVLRASDLTSSCVPTGDIIRTTVDLVRKMWKQGSATYTNTQVKICSPIELAFGSNMTNFNWQSLIHYTDSSFSSVGNYISIPGYLQSWNGNLISGGQMTAPQNVGGKPSNVNSLTPGGTLLIQKTCDGQFNFLPSAGFGMSFNFGVMRTMVDHWVSTITGILKCRFNALGLNIGDQEMRNRWGLGLEWLFYNVDAKRANDRVGDGLDDFRLNLGSRVNLPSSCNYDTWVKDGACHAQYTGLSNLLGVDVTANIEVKKCDSSSDFSFAVECVGAACSLLNLKTKPCNSDADCPNSLTCQDLNSKMGTYDWMAAYASVNTTKNPSCVRSPDGIHADVRKLAFSYLGLQYDGSSENKYCMIDYDHVASQGSTWLNGEYDSTTTAGVVTLKNLQSWDGAGTTAPAVSSGLTATISYVVGALALALAIMFH